MSESGRQKHQLKAVIGRLLPPVKIDRKTSLEVSMQDRANRTFAKINTLKAFDKEELLNHVNKFKRPEPFTDSEKRADELQNLMEMHLIRGDLIYGNFHKPNFSELEAAKPKILDLTKQLVCDLRIPFREGVDQFPLSLFTDHPKARFEFYVSFTARKATTNEYDTYQAGNIVSVSPSTIAKFHNTITVCFKAIKPAKIAISYSYSKMQQLLLRRDNHDDPFSKENVEKIRGIYRQIYHKVQARKKAEKSKPNHVKLNISSQSARPESHQISQREKSQARTVRQKDARAKSNDIAFEKVKKALLQTYMHDYKLYLQDQDEKKNYRKNLKRAICAFWIHNLIFCRFAMDLKEKIFQLRYKLLREKVDKAKRTFAVKLLKKVLEKFVIGKQNRDVMAVSNSLELYTKLLDIPKIVQECKEVIQKNLFTSWLVTTVQAKEALLARAHQSSVPLVTIVVGIQSKFRENRKRRTKIIDSMNFYWERSKEELLYSSKQKDDIKVAIGKAQKSPHLKYHLLSNVLANTFLSSFKYCTTSSSTSSQLRR